MSTSLHMFAVSLVSYSSMENPSNCFWAPEPGSMAKAEERGDPAGGGDQDESLWHLLQLMETNSKDQRSNFPLSDYINIVFIQVIEGLQNQRIPPATSAHLTVDPWELFQPELLPEHQQIHSQLSFSGRDTNLRLCTVPVLVSYSSQELPLFFSFNYSFCEALLKLTNKLLKQLLWVTAETQTTWQLLRAWLPLNSRLRKA